jgi:hypothetical protein
MHRLFWLALGATLGVLIFRKLARAVEQLTPRGIAAGVGTGLTELAYAVRDFADDVRDASAGREAELREAAGLDGPGSETAR